MERWMPVSGWDGIYEVSDRGRVRRIIGGVSTYAGRILRPIPHRLGYPTVRLRYQGREAKPRIHCIVAEAFIGPRPNKMHINHKDGNTGNPRLSNLEYVTCSENHYHAYRVLGRKGRQLFGERNNAAKLSSKQVSEIIRRYKTGKVTQKQLAARFGVSQPMISKIVLKKLWTMLDSDPTRQRRN